CASQYSGSWNANFDSW
nr:immunoglobulin heavy chain junction region [Macaca mulatta]